ncbi:MAG: DUF4097 family beta strand repeat-containing protein [Candidatus Margulisbacteria bacterium]|nr:DUF4097 family beta strand repeat-containing protein [Candidatus Margulisiibacteriota bacterium]
MSKDNIVTIPPPPPDFPRKYAKNIVYYCEWISIIILLALFIAGCGKTTNDSSNSSNTTTIINPPPTTYTFTFQEILFDDTMDHANAKSGTIYVGDVDDGTLYIGTQGANGTDNTGSGSFTNNVKTYTYTIPRNRRIELGYQTATGACSFSSEIFPYQNTNPWRNSNSGKYTIGTGSPLIMNKNYTIAMKVGFGTVNVTPYPSDKEDDDASSTNSSYLDNLDANGVILKDLDYSRMFGNIDLINNAKLQNVKIGNMYGNITASNSTLESIKINNMLGNLTIRDSTLTDVTITALTGTLTLTNCTYSNVKIRGTTYAN